MDGEIPEYGYIKIKNGEIVGYNLSLENKNYIETSSGVDEVEEDPIKTAAELSIDYVNQEIIKGISFSYEEYLTFNFYIDKEKVSDKNISTFTSGGEKLYSELLTAELDLENNNGGEGFSDAGLTITTSTVSMSRSFSFSETLKGSTNFIESDMEKYGYLLFNEASYNNLEDKGIDYFNKESQELLDTIQLDNPESTVMLYNGKLYFKYSLLLKEFYKYIYIRPYYINEDGMYVYDTLRRYSPLIVLKIL